MITHPDADSFMRVALRDPTDLTTRLIFADWLEDTGEPSNVAWARYIRLKAEAAQLRFGSPDWAEREADAAGQAWRVRANLTIPTALFVDYPRSLLQLLPAPNITVRLDGFDVPQHLVDLLPESVARDHLVLPLDQQEGVLLLAASDPHNCDTVDRVRFILNRDVVAVRAEPDDVALAIERHYGQAVLESIDSIHWESPLVGLEGDWVSREIGGVFLTAFSMSATALEFRRTANGYHLDYAAGDEFVGLAPYSEAVYRRLFDHLASLPVEREYHAGDARCVDVDIPLLSGRPCPATLQHPLTPGDVPWFRVHFRWHERG